MSRNVSRRRVLGVLGSVAVAGCTGSSGGRQSFDTSAIDRVTEPPMPDRPDPLPVSLSENQLHQFEGRVETLLEPVPEDLGPDVLPNGEFRSMIVDDREAARTALERMRDTDHSILEASKAIEACASAAAANGIWSHVVIQRSTSDIPVSPRRVNRRAQEFDESIPTVAGSVQEGAVLYPHLSDWLSYVPDLGYEDVRRGIVPAQTGERASDRESERARLAALERLHDRYRAILADPISVREPTIATLEALETPIWNRLDRYYDGDVPTRIRGRPVEEYLGSDVPDEHPGKELLRDKMKWFFLEHSVGHVAYLPREIYPDATDLVNAPAHLRTAHSAIAHFDAFDAIRERLEDGDDFRPDDAAEIGDARSGAIDVVSRLAASAAPLDRWSGWELYELLDRTDGELAEDGDRREHVATYTEYVWIRIYGQAAADATVPIESASAG